MAAWSGGLGRRQGVLVVVASTLGSADHYGGVGGRVSSSGVVRVVQGEVRVIPDSRATFMALARGGGGGGGRHGWRHGHFVKIVVPT